MTPPSARAAVRAAAMTAREPPRTPWSPSSRSSPRSRANGVIGADNRLPWRLPDDLKRFRALTHGPRGDHGPQDLGIAAARAAGAAEHRRHAQRGVRRRRAPRSSPVARRRARRASRCRRPRSASAAASSIATRCRCATTLHLTEIDARLRRRRPVSARSTATQWREIAREDARRRDDGARVRVRHLRAPRARRCGIITRSPDRALIARPSAAGMAEWQTQRTQNPPVATP